MTTKKPSSKHKAPQKDLLRGLNPQQTKAVKHGEGPLLILAGAGSGKTTTMARRMAFLIGQKNIPAENILGLSFTNKAAKELKERIVKIAGHQARGLRVSTFHSLGVWILRQEAQHLGYDPHFSIVDQNDQLEILKEIFKKLKVDDRRFDLPLILFIFGRVRGEKQNGSEIVDTDFYELAPRFSEEYLEVGAAVYPEYRERLKALNSMDFDDLVFQSVELLENHLPVKDKYNRIFRYLLVDEYQDTNGAQFRLIRNLTQHQQNICVVGDDDQSIYAWRGADPRHILGFNKHFPHAKVITLDQNYRSTKTILDLANQVIQLNPKRYPKKLWSNHAEGEPIKMLISENDRDEPEFVADTLEEMAFENREGQRTQVRPYKNFAILFRSNAQTRSFEESLRSRQIPYRVVGGLSFLDRREIKDLIHYWRSFVNPLDDTAIRRVINWPRRGLGPGTVNKINHLALQSGVSFIEAAAQLLEEESFKPGIQKSLQSFVDLIMAGNRKLRNLPAEELSQWGIERCEAMDLKNALLEDGPSEKGGQQWENILEMVQSLGKIKFSPQAKGIVVLRDYLANLMLQSKDSDRDNSKETEKDEVSLLTLHSAKGLEFPNVFMVGMDDGILPHRRVLDEGDDLSEERRLCYVGITRAKNQLILSRCKNRIRWGKAQPQNICRFFDHISMDQWEIDDRSTPTSDCPNQSSEKAQEKHEERVKSFLSNIRANLEG